MKDKSMVENFFDYMYETIKEHGFSKTSIAQRAGLSRDYVFKILNPNSGKRIFDRDYLIAMCIAAKMTYRETQHALELYPFPVLDDADERSGLIMYALRHSLSLDELNDFLSTRGFPMIRTSPEMEKATIGPVRSTRFGEQDVTSSHDEELIAAVIRRMHMNNKKDIEVWREGWAGNYGMYAEMKFSDKNGVEKYAQLFESGEVSSISVSKISLHDEEWTEDSCEECWDTFQAEEAIGELEDDDEDCDDDEDLVDYDEVKGESHYRMMFKIAAGSKYFTKYLALDKALDDYYFGSGEELEAEEIKNEMTDAEHVYTVVVELIKKNDSGECVEESKRTDFKLVKEAVSYAEEVYNDLVPIHGDVMRARITVETDDARVLWDDGKRK